MNYQLLAVSLMLSAWLLLSAFLTLVGTRVWRTRRTQAAFRSPYQRARLLFALRTWPAAGAAVAVLGILLPAFIAHEPRQTDEAVSPALVIPALLCLAGASLAIRCGVRAWRTTRRLVTEWKHRAERLSETGGTVGTLAGGQIWRIPHPLPVIAVAGIVRPQLFIADQLFNRLSEEELAAVLRHEGWHLVVRDNLRRLLFACCQHLLFFLPGARQLESEWRESVEMAADDYAAGNDPQRALDLASGLLRIAKLFPPGAAVTAPATVSFVATDDRRLACRVERLLQIAESDAQPRGGSGRFFNPAFGLAAVLFFCAILTIASQPKALRTVHQGIELLVGILP